MSPYASPVVPVLHLGPKKACAVTPTASSKQPHHPGVSSAALPSDTQHSTLIPASSPKALLLSCVGHYPNDNMTGSAAKQAQLHSAPSPSGRNRSQSVPHPYSSQHPPKGPSTYRASMNGPQRHSHGQSLPDDGSHHLAYAPETPSPLEQRQPARAASPSTNSSQVQPDNPPHPLSSAPPPILAEPKGKPGVTVSSC